MRGQSCLTDEAVTASRTLPDFTARTASVGGIEWSANAIAPTGSSESTT